MPYKFQPASPDYRSQAIELLGNHNLPVSDLDEGKELFVLLDDQDRVIGTGGLEIFGDQALVRSVSVSKEYQGRGLGKYIVKELEQAAIKKDVHSLYLLTTTAKDFFEKEGYDIVQREDLPPAIRETGEFKSLCPSTATAMKKNLFPKKKLLFVCIENSNRSQMSQAFAILHGGKNVEAYSAGSRPSGKVNPRAIEAMRQLGYDLSKHDSKSLQEVEKYAPFDVVVTMGCGDACPWMPARKFVDWDIPDPRNMEPAEFNKVRDLLSEKVKVLLKEI